jgi:pimeloyl-ACP methyl ester carboxylesterase
MVWVEFLVGFLLLGGLAIDALSSQSLSSSSSSSLRDRCSTGSIAAYDLSTILNVATQQFSDFQGGGYANGVCGGRLVSMAGLFRESFLLVDRDVTVWLPPGYDDNNDKYSVIYCHDGQNTIKDEESWTGSSWRLAGAVTKLAEQQRIHRPPILVLVPSAPGDLLLPGVRRRHLEYGSLNTPFATAHTDLVAQVIKPAIDGMFRTNREASHTFAMGTSLGGQASMNLLLKYPEMFGGVACLSPYFSTDTIARASAMAGLLFRSHHQKRIYLDIGGDTEYQKVPLFDWQDHLTPSHWWNPGYFWLDTSLQASVNAINFALTTKTTPCTTTHPVQYRNFPGARHNERAWSHRIHWPLLHLLESSSSSQR